MSFLLGVPGIILFLFVIWLIAYNCFLQTYCSQLEIKKNKSKMYNSGKGIIFIASSLCMLHVLRGMFEYFIAVFHGFTIPYHILYVTF